MNQATLAVKLKKFRRERGLSLRDIEEATSIPYSSLSRFENGGCFDFDNLARIAAYLGGPFSENVVTEHPDSTIDAICDVIRKDETLTESRAKTLCELMRLCYAEFTEK